MSAIPALDVDDAFIDGLACPICATSSLTVNHIGQFPDFVSCGNCGSAFVVEDTGERVMYGKIPAEYPETAAFALKQWVWLEAVGRRADIERPKPPVTAEPAEKAVPELPEPDEAEESSTDMQEEPAGEAELLASRLRTSGAWSAGVPIPTEPDPPAPPTPAVVLSPESEPLPDWLKTPRGVLMEPPAPPAPAPAPAGPAVVEDQKTTSVAVRQAGEPSPDQRTRVTLRGDRVRFPINTCAHCLRIPAPARLPVAGSLPRPTGLGGRRGATFRIPLCANCRKRAAARSPEQGGGRLQAHLLSALVSLVLVVLALALNLVSFDGSGLGAFLALGIIAILGYAVPVVILLGRSGQAPWPADARFVSSTLLVRGSPLSPETVFAWRHAGYADIFYEANRAATTGGPTPTDEDADIV